MLDDHLNAEPEILIQQLPGLPGSFPVELARLSLNLGSRPGGYLNWGVGLLYEAVNPASVSVSLSSIPWATVDVSRIIRNIHSG